MTITSLIWNKKNIEHIASHNVTPKEIEEVCIGYVVTARDMALSERRRFRKWKK
jgi:hypothetical protein